MSASAAVLHPAATQTRAWQQDSRIIGLMCGRFARRSTREVLADWFGVDLEDLPTFPASYNIAPQSVQPVVRLGQETGAREFALLRWGLVPFWAKDAKIGYSTINARVEEVANKPAFREALRKRRCLIPADAFYEWAKRDAKTKQPFAIGLRSGEPFAFAGLWERWRPKEGDALETFTILTTDANEALEPIHNRMPVILGPEHYSWWLEPRFEPEFLKTLLRSFPAERMDCRRVSAWVNNARNDGPECVLAQ